MFCFQSWSAEVDSSRSLFGPREKLSIPSRCPFWENEYGLFVNRDSGNNDKVICAFRRPFNLEEKPAYAVPRMRSGCFQSPFLAGLLVLLITMHNRNGGGGSHRSSEGYNLLQILAKSGSFCFTLSQRYLRCPVATGNKAHLFLLVGCV